MFDQLDALDDATPPSPDAAMLARVRGRADRHRRRNRLTATGACIAALAVAVGGVAVVRDHGQRLDVVTPATSPATAATTIPIDTPHPVTEGLMLNGLQLRLTLETPTVQLGDNIRMQVSVHNDTAKIKGIGGGGSIQCALGVGPVLSDTGGRDVSENLRGGPCITSIKAVLAGQSVTFPVVLATTPVTVGAPRDHFELRLESASPDSGSAWTRAPDPLGVNVTAPDLSARIEIPKTTFTPGTDIHGTLVIDNHGASAVHYTDADCTGSPWQVLLSKNGTDFSFATAAPGCVRYDASLSALPPGTTRGQFDVPLVYPSCVGLGRPTVDDPKCVGLVAPPLALGAYQLVFRGTDGPFASIAVAPLPIRVVAAG